MSRSTSSAAFIERLKTALGLQSSSDLAAALGVAPTTLSNWCVRGSRLPWCVFEFADFNHVDLTWLITGREQVSPLASWVMQQDDIGALFDLDCEQPTQAPISLELAQRLLRQVLDRELTAPELRRLLAIAEQPTANEDDTA